MSFMEPQIWNGKFIEVSVKGEVCHIDAAVFGESDGAGNWGEREIPWPDTTARWDELSHDDKCKLIPEVEGYVTFGRLIHTKNVDYIIGINGWGAQLAAPGYTDQTELGVFETEKEAREWLEEVHDICRICETEIEEDASKLGYHCKCTFHTIAYNATDEPANEHGVGPVRWRVVRMVGDDLLVMVGGFTTEESAREVADQMNRAEK